ncbi:MAG: hypothetical protein DA408_07080 [Bacteroidetes bacterium]|nr:MAG: hypothetical protein C7N36_18625 [Bacteroidota bacterium]PTM13361.1 MAG: hypothetical protein DA408_07080 [Bacteroidota bacterium]
MKILLIAVQLFLATTIFCQTNSNDLLGVWLNESGNGKVEFYQVGDQFFGKIIWINPKENPTENLTDLKNPNPKLRGRPVQNMEVISHLTFEENEWVRGSAYSQERGEYFKCKNWLTSSRELKVRGYVGWFYQTETWEKVF